MNYLPERTLRIDFETYGSEPIEETGLYKYTASLDFEILMAAYQLDSNPVDIFCPAEGDTVPGWFVDALTDNRVKKAAYNAPFEMNAIGNFWSWDLIIPHQWWCTQVHAAMAGWALNLGVTAKVMGLVQQKDTEGKKLINYFSVPCKPTKKNGGRRRNHWHHDLEKWEAFKRYCMDDVRTEAAVAAGVSWYEIPAFERMLWIADFEKQRRGVLLDVDLAQVATEVDQEYIAKSKREFHALTGLTTSKSKFFKEWLSDREPAVDFSSVTKKTLPEIRKQVTSTDVTRALDLHTLMNFSSVAKYSAMVSMSMDDNRARGVTQFYGANRTGREAGRGIQVQNLTKNYVFDNDLRLCRELLRSKKTGALEVLYGDLPHILSMLVRTIIVADPGRKLGVADFKAIEARVLAWLAGETWRLEVFRGHGKIYEASAAAMFKVPFESIDKKSPLRQRGKVAELALGYQGSVGALIQMGALTMGVPEDELPVLVYKWRRANKFIVTFWQDLEKAAKHVLSEPGSRVRVRVKGSPMNAPVFVTFSTKRLSTGTVMLITLPSGRQLAYQRAHLEPAIGKIRYEGLRNEPGKPKIWTVIDTYGGKLAENITQAVARDIMFHANYALEQFGYLPLFNVHDETVLDIADDTPETLENIETIMGKPIPWAPELPLGADVYACDFYHKDE